MPQAFATTRSTSERMRKVRQQDTAPEMIVRRALHRMGYRFRLHRRDLPGHPDVVLPKYKSAIFVHGCFWHGHPNCRRAIRPASNTDYWNRRLDRNIERDQKTIADLEQAGWRVLVAWECEIKSQAAAEQLLRAFLVDQADAAGQSR